MKFNDRITRVIEAIDTPGEFATEGIVETPLCDLVIDGVGQIAFPLVESQAQRIAEVAEPAPYGRGPETIVDTDVRRTLQLAPARFTIDGEAWGATVEEITRNVSRQLGVTQPTRAELYKLLLYREGDFFTEHRDSEKADGMFATLVIALPSKWQGGELVVRHAGDVRELHVRSESISRVAFAAFFTDCLHELKPVVSGHRLVLVYNLIREDGVTEFAPDLREHVEPVASALSDWTGGAKLLYVLDHHYSPAELDFDRLKGVDAGRAAVLREACERAGCDLHLAMVSLEESGGAEYVGYSTDRYGRGPSSDDRRDSWEIWEAYDSSRLVEDLQRPDGSMSSFPPLPFWAEEVAPEGALTDEDFDRIHFWEATGNEGASYSRTYRRAAFVVWPGEHRTEIAASLGADGAAALIEELERDGVENLGAVAREILSKVIENWVIDPSGRGYRYDPESGSGLLEEALRLDEHEIVREFVSRVVVGRGVLASEATILARACAVLDEETSGAMVEELAEEAREELAPIARMLAELARLPERNATQDSIYEGLMGAAVDGVGGHRSFRADLQEELGHLLRAVATRPEFVEQLRTALEREQHLYDFDRVLLPALLSVSDEVALERDLESIWKWSVGKLEERIARPLPDPEDLAVDFRSDCDCQWCDELNEFLEDSERESIRIPVRKEIRKHLYRLINNVLQLDASTIRQGSPYTWVCTKVATMHETQLEEVASDREMLERLGASR